MLATANRFSFAVSDSLHAKVLSRRPRRISFETGTALEKLSHAIDYLRDECVRQGGSVKGSPDCIETVHTLMALRELIYDEAPEKVLLGERIGVLLAKLVGSGFPRDRGTLNRNLPSPQPAGSETQRAV